MSVCLPVSASQTVGSIMEQTMHLFKAPAPSGASEDHQSGFDRRPFSQSTVHMHGVLVGKCMQCSLCSFKCLYCKIEYQDVGKPKYLVAVFGSFPFYLDFSVYYC